MVQDKNWTIADRTSEVWKNGVEQFIAESFPKVGVNGLMSCPCHKCKNSRQFDLDTIKRHIIWSGMVQPYGMGPWYLHGEDLPPREVVVEVDEVEHADNVVDDQFVDGDDVDVADDMIGLLEDVGRIPLPPDGSEAAKFYKLVEDASIELYPGCKKFSKLSFMVRLYHIKCFGKMSNKAFTMLLELFREVIPDSNIPSSYYETNKLIGGLGIGYTKIHACKNDCMLFWKDHRNDDNCSVCGTSRWMPKRNKVPAKVLRHFPLKPRLQRLFMCAKTASFMKWHANERKKDGVLRHPADAEAWQYFDARYPDFANDIRNVRLGLATDGFSPFGQMTHGHSTWPVVLFVYNLAPWYCTKAPYTIMSLLIPGPESPGNDIDVYLQPLMDELKDLWYEGINTYDASSRETFQMYAALSWTVCDFPANAMVSGWSTKGKLACPNCHEDIMLWWLKKGHKFCYMGHPRFLDDDSAPQPLTGEQVIERTENTHV